ncbi:baculoviral IAP repeat-containing protein 1e-like isoform X2 [Amphiura filiformis]|uniref:baculoviral IAP repeat-containing protein 1e-like isoform X2 n=1 Tax=Amphiura filiformis TaxID=82378 RepID=UPI003B2268E8
MKVARPGLLRSEFHDLSVRIGSEWEKLATFLGLSPNMVNKIKLTNTVDEDCVFAVLVQWQQQMYKNTNIVKTLVKALENSGRKDLAAELQERAEKQKKENKEKDDVKRDLLKIYNLPPVGEILKGYKKMRNPTIPFELFMELCIALDHRDVLGNDWRKLAQKLELGRYIFYLESEYTGAPTSAVLWCWMKKNKSLQELAKTLDEMNRGNVALKIKAHLGIGQHEEDADEGLGDDELGADRFEDEGVADEIQQQLRKTYRERYQMSLVGAEPYEVGHLLRIGLKVVEDSNPSVYQRGKVLTSYSDLFRIVDSAKELRKQLILYGNPGSGKTTLISQIALHWTRFSQKKPSRTPVISRYKFVIVISCHRIKPHMNLVDIITDQCSISIAKEDIVAVLGQHPCLFLVDGYDELPCDVKLDVFKDSLLERNFVLVTSRSSEVEKFCFDHPQFIRLSITSLSVTQVHTYIRYFFGQQSDAGALIDEINSNQYIQLLISIHQLKLLIMICTAWQKLPEHRRSLQVTSVFQNMVGYMSLQLRAREETDDLDIDAVLGRVGKVAINCLFENELSIEVKQFKMDDIECVLKLGLVQRDVSAATYHICSPNIS